MSDEIQDSKLIEGLAFGRSVDGNARVRDTDLADFLGYERPADIRELIGRHVDGEKLCGDGVIRTVRKNAGRGRPALEYWLTREQALFVVFKCDLPKANELTKTVIERFLAYERGAAVKDRIRLYLVSSPQEYQRLWEDEVIDALASVYRIDRDPTKGFPVWLCGIAGKLYDRIWSSEIAEDVRSRNPHANGIKFFQYLTPEARTMTLVELSFIRTMAMQSRDAAEFWSRVNNRYRGEPFQFALPLSTH